MITQVIIKANILSSMVCLQGEVAQSESTLWVIGEVSQSGPFYAYCYQDSDEPARSIQ